MHYHPFVQVNLPMTDLEKDWFRATGAHIFWEAGKWYLRIGLICSKEGFDSPREVIERCMCPMGPPLL